MKFRLTPVFYLLLLSTFLFSGSVFAQQFNSTSFVVENPVINAGEYSSSGSFKLQSVISQISNGTSTSVSFGANAGFLYFPYVTTPVVGATAGNGQVALSWTSAVGELGWNVGGYTVGQGTVSGGPYSYASVGNVTSSTRSGLTNGTAYYFIVVAEDAFGNHISTSTEVTSTPTAPATPPPTTGGGSSGGGGGGGVFGNQTIVNFSGRAYPRSTVTLLKDAQVSATTIAGADSNFQISLNNLSAGNYIFSVYGEDKNGVRSSLLTFPVSVTSGATTNIGGIFLAPTISVDKSEVKKGDNIAIFGQSVPRSEITIVVNSDEEYFGKVLSDLNGVYLYNFDTVPLEYGGHSTKSKAAIVNEISSFSKAVGFQVGTKNVLMSQAKKLPEKGDVNSDGKVNLVDFSIAAFWYKRVLSNSFSVIEKSKLSGDGKVNLVDFSIMAYYWTG